jgi:phosphoribulokinase
MFAKNYVMEKTPVEWLIEQLELKSNDLDYDTIKKYAIAFERQEIIKAHDTGVDAGYMLAKNDDIYIDSTDFKNTCNSPKYYFSRYKKGEQ